VVSLGQVHNFFVHLTDSNVEFSVLFTELHKFSLESSEDIDDFGESVLEFTDLSSIFRKSVSQDFDFLGVVIGVPLEVRLGHENEVLFSEDDFVAGNFHSELSNISLEFLLFLEQVMHACLEFFEVGGRAVVLEVAVELDTDIGNCLASHSAFVASLHELLYSVRELLVKVNVRLADECQILFG
jgi:hypothetical protein